MTTIGTTPSTSSVAIIQLTAPGTAAGNASSKPYVGGNGKDPYPMRGSAESGTPDNEAIILADARDGARMSARRAAFNGDSTAAAIKRIKKQWPVLIGPAGEVQQIVESAYAWYDYWKPGSSIVIGGIEKRVTSFAALNKRFARLEVPNNQACIILRNEARPIPLADFHLRLSGEVVCLGIDSEGEPSWEVAPKVWLQSAAQHVYRRIAFTNKPVPDDTLNLFRGYGVVAKEGDCRLILQHILEVICANDAVAYEAMLNLIAWQLQHIGEPSRIIVALISKRQQTGKGRLLEAVLLEIFGLFAGLKVSKIEEITGNFNAILRGKAFIFLDEALWRGDKRAANEVKSLVATQTVALNEKFLPRVHTPTGVNIWLASNEEVPVYAEEKDARYWPMWISEHRWVGPERTEKENAENIRYWEALQSEIDSGGREAFLHMMLSRDVSGFRPQRDVPRKNQAHAALVRGGLDQGDPRFWLEESLDNVVLMDVLSPEAAYDDMLTPAKGLEAMQAWVPGKEIPAGDIIRGYRTWVSKLRGYGITTVNPRDFWQLLTQCGFVQTRTKHERLRVIPDLDECRRHLTAVLGAGDDGSEDPER